METRTKVLVLRTATIALLLPMPVGSPGDKVALIIFALLLTSRRTVHAFRDLVRSSFLLPCAMYSSLAIVATWGNSRYRLGGGPFHLDLGSDWRGYPFPFQEAVLIPNGQLWREFCWTGALADALFVLIGCVAVTYFIRPGIAQVPRIVFSSAYSAAFVWLNIETWLYGAPALFIRSPNNIDDAMRVMQTATLGFPFVYMRFDGGQDM